MSNTKSDNDTAVKTSNGGENAAKKVVVRRLPPSMTKEQFIEIVAPLPEHEYFYYCNADMR